jgi:hypothetical protein
MEQADCFHLVPAFELRPDHPRLDGKRDEEQEVVARYAEQATTRNGEHRGEKEAGE